MSDPRAPQPPAGQQPAATPPKRRRRLARRALPWALLSLALLTVLLAVLLWAALWTEAGARTVFGYLDLVLPGELEAEELRGTAWGPLEITGLVWKSERVTIQVDHVRFEWRLQALLRRQVDIRFLHAQGVKVWVKPAPEPVDELRDIDFGYKIALHKALIEDFQLFRPESEEPLVIDRMELDTVELEDYLHITRFELWSPHIDIEVAGSLRARGDYDINLELDWALRLPDLPELEGRGTLAGTLVELELRQRLTQPFPAELQGSLYDPLQDLRFAFDATFESVEPQLFHPDAPAMVARGGASIEGRSLVRFRARGHLAAATQDWGPVDADFRIEREADLWRLERVELRRPRTSTLAVVVGTYQAEGPGRFEGNVRWQDLQWPLDREPVWRSPEGRVDAAGSLDRYRVQGEAQVGTDRIPVGSYVFTAQGSRRAATIQRLTGTVLGGTVQANGEIRWEPELAYRGNLLAHGIDLGPLAPQLPPEVARASRWDVAAHGSAQGLTADRLDVDLLEGRVRGRGTLTWEPTIRWSFAGTAAEIDPARVWPQVPGELAAGTFWNLDLVGTDTTATIRTLQGRALGGQVAVSGEVGWEPRIRWDLSLRADAVQPHLLWPEWPGELDLVGTSSGVVVDEGLLGTLALDQAGGVLRGRPLQATADLGFRGEHWDLRHLEATWGPAHLLASGDVGRTLDVHFQLVSLELGALIDDASGRLEALGQVRGPRAAPRVTATLAGTNVGYRELLAQTLTGEVDLGLSPGDPFALDLEARELVAPGRRAEILVVRGRGVREDHWLTATLAAQEGGLELALEGGLFDDRWQGTLSTLHLESQRVGVWDLEAPAPLLLATDRLAVGQVCWVSGQASLCGTGEWVRGGPLEVIAALDQLPLTLVEPWAPDELRLEGTVDGNVILGTDAARRLVGELELRPASGTTIAPWGRPDASLTLAEGDLLVRAFPDQLHGALHLRFEEDGELRGGLTLPGYTLGRPLADQPVTGELHGHLAEIAFLEGVVPDLADLRGRIELALSLDGTVGAPDYTGTARVTQGQARVPRLGLELEEIELMASGDGVGPLRVEGTLRSGPGTLEIAGEGHLLVAPGRPIRLALQGTEVEVLDNEHGRVVANPDLELAYDREQLQISGTVEVPHARITHREGDVPAVVQSVDAVYITEEPEALPPPAVRLWARVRVILGDDVRFAARGLDTRVVGSLLVLEEPGRPTRAIGELESRDGSLALYGRVLEITFGRLTFAGGPITQPLINVRASRTARDAVVAGIDVRGTVQEPDVTLWSDPAMSETEVLAYLVLGRPWSPEAQPDMMGQATTTLGLQAGQLIAQTLGARLGLEEVAIVTEETLDEAMLLLGAYLSPRLFVAYGIGLFDPVSTFRIRYLIDHHWTLQAETGGLRTGGDLLYTVERGGPERAMRLPRPERMEELETLPIPAPRDAPEGVPPDREEEEEEEETVPAAGGDSE